MAAKKEATKKATKKATAKKKEDPAPNYGPKIAKLQQEIADMKVALGAKLGISFDDASG